MPPFERTTGHKVTLSYDPSGRLGKRLREGEFADMILMASGELDKLIAEGKVRDRTEISRTGIALAVKKGAPHPDVSTPEALKRTLLAAKSIGYTGPASGGGITAAPIMRRVRRSSASRPKSRPRPSSRRAARTAASACWWQTAKPRSACSRSSELMSNPDVEVIGMLPDGLQKITINAAGVTAIAKEPDAAHALIRHLMTPEALAIYKARDWGSRSAGS